MSHSTVGVIAQGQLFALPPSILCETNCPPSDVVVIVHYKQPSRCLNLKHKVAFQYPPSLSTNIPWELLNMQFAVYF